MGTTLLTTGQLIDRYTVEAHLGSGGMAEVYRVRHTTTNGLHALKVLKSGNPKVRERLLQEARVQASLRHPNAVAVTDVVDVDGAPGLVMEYVDGPSLVEWLEQDQPDLATRLDVFRAVLKGVRRAHDLDVVHRDLSPHNVLIERTADGPHPKVTDFGIAKVLDPDRAAANKTRAGHPMGTPAFMAPEQVRDASDVDQRADIWALGSMLYLLVSDRLAFDGKDILEIFNKIAQAAYPEPPEGLPPNIVATIRGCLTVDRDQRLQDCAAVAELLDRPTPAPVPAPPPQVQWEAASPSPESLVTPSKSPRTARLAVVGASLTLILAGAGAWLVLHAPSEPPTDAQTTTAPAQVPEEQVPEEQVPEEQVPAQVPAQHPAQGQAPAPAEAAGLGAEPPTPEDAPTPTPTPTAKLSAAPQQQAPDPTAATVAETAAAAATTTELSAATGSWTLAGDVQDVWLHPSKGGGRYPPGDVPAGSYAVKADGTVQFTVKITDGGQVQITCTDHGGWTTCQ